MQQLAQIPIGQSFFGGSGGSHGSTSFLQSTQGVGSLVSVFLKGAFTLAGVSILIFLIMAGIGMIAGAGENNPQKAAQAKQTATSALIGFVVVFVAYFLVKLIGEILGITII